MNTEKINQRIACKAIVQYGPKVLILREAATYADGTNVGKYQLPGGRLEPGEPFLEGLAREVFEETGLRVTGNRPVFVGEWFPVIRGVRNQIVAIFFACAAQTDQVQLSSEHDKYQWIDPATYPRYDLVAPEDRALEAFLSTRPKEV